MTIQRAAVRVRSIALLAVAVALVVAGCDAEAGVSGKTRIDEHGDSEIGTYRGVVLAEPLPMPDMTLEDTSGRPFDLREESRGTTTLLFFGYTHCPDVCPVHMGNLAAVLDDLGWDARSKIQVVFVSVDPERDTPERMRAWLDRFSSDFVGLRGPPERVAGVQRALRLAPTVFQPLPDGGETVGHASQVVAFTADGMARVVYPFGTRQADWRHDLPLLLEASDAGADVAAAGRGDGR